MHDPQSPTHEPVPEVSAKRLAEECAGDTAPVLIDVREGWEFTQGSIAGALHLPVGQIAERPKDALGLDHDADIVTFCHHGVRSQRAGQALRQAGYTRVRSLEGGIDAWATDVDSRVGRY